MKLYRKMLIFLAPPDHPNVARVTMMTVNCDKSLEKHDVGNGATVEDIAIQVCIKRWLRYANIDDAFEVWYKKNIDTIEHDPFYPQVYLRLRLLKNINVFLETQPGYEFTIIDDEIDLKVFLE